MIVWSFFASGGVEPRCLTEKGPRGKREVDRNGDAMRLGMTDPTFVPFTAGVLASRLKAALALSFCRDENSS